MHNREIKIFNIASTMLDSGQVNRWVASLGAPDYRNHDQANDCEATIGLAAKRCYMAFEPGMNPNVTKVRNDWVLYFDNILKSGHGSVLEHASYTYAIENVSRVFTAEMNRHRAGTAISEGSMRYIRFDDIPFWMPLSIRGNDTEFGELWLKDVMAFVDEGKIFEIPDGTDDDDRKTVTRALFRDAFTKIQQIYNTLLQVWEIDDGNFDKKKKLTSMFRRIIPMGVCTGGVWTFNIRAMRHILAMRSTPHAEEEIAFVWSLIAKDIMEKEPNLFGDFEEVDGFWVPKYQKV